jgi:hypothetical protein
MQLPGQRVGSSTVRKLINPQVADLFEDGRLEK